MQSDEEEVGPDGEKKKKKKGLKEKIKEKIGGEKKEEHEPSKEEIKTTTVAAEEVAVTPPPPATYNEDTSIKVEKVDDSVKLEDVSPHEEEKKGILEKIKEKLPGQKKPSEEVPATTTVACEEVNSSDGKEKKGILGKIMEKIKGPEHKEAEKSGENH
jgi:Dehydrin